MTITKNAPLWEQFLYSDGATHDVGIEGVGYGTADLLT